MSIKDYSFIELSGKCRPMLWIRVTNPQKGRSIIGLAMVDTGADQCAFPAKVGKNLQYKPESAVATNSIITASGETVAHSHISTIEVLKPDAKGRATDQVVSVIKDVTVAYAEGLCAYLLGDQGFLCNFVLEIDYPNKKFSVRAPKN